MAKKVQVLLVDDIDKSSPADETVSFSLDGVSYEIDLTSDNAAKLRDDLAVWIGHAERTGGRRSSGRTASKGSGRKADLGAVRAEFFGKKGPASTLVGVSALAFPDLMVEIEAIAVL